MGEQEGKSKKENEDHEDDISHSKGGTEASSDLMAGCMDAIIKQRHYLSGSSNKKKNLF